MPLYTYRCENAECVKCDIIIEQKRSVDDRNKEELCECNQSLHRVPEETSPPILKGEGFTPKFHR